MGIELYNTSRATRYLPTTDYSKKISIKPKQSVPINDSDGAFYAPYAKVGVVVRRSFMSEELVQKTVDIVKNTENIEDTKVEIPDEVPLEMESTENQTEVRFKEVEDEEVSIKKEYSEEELSKMSLKQIRDVLKELKISTSDIKGDTRKKETLISAIISSQNLSK